MYFTKFLNAFVKPRNSNSETSNCLRLEIYDKDTKLAIELKTKPGRRGEYH